MGLASGDSALRNIGVAPSTVADLEHYAVTVHELTAGRAHIWDSTPLQLHWLDRPLPVPIWIAAEGPRTQRMAGRVAHGVILSNSLTSERMAVAREHIAEGAAEAGRDIDDIEIWCMCNLIFAASEREGIDSIRSVLAGTANHVYRFGLDGKGLPDEYRDRVQAMMAEYESRHHAQPGAANPNNELVDKYGLRDFLARQGTIAGPPDECVQRIREVAAIGADRLIVSQFVTDQHDWMRTFESRVLPAFR